MVRVFDGLAKFLDQIEEFDAKLAILPNDAGLLGDRALLFLRCGDAELALDDAESGKGGAWTVRPRLFQAIALTLLNRGHECERYRCVASSSR